MERCISVQPTTNNNIDSDGSFCEIGPGSVVVYDHQTADDIKMIEASSSSLHSAGTAAEVNSLAKEGLRVYVCDVCSRRLFTAPALQRHRRRHKDCATCSECGHSFHLPAVLRHHSLMQCPRKMVTCNVCRESFEGWPSLSRHTATMYSSAIICSLCGQAFPHVSQLVTHRSVHDTYVYRCRICHKRFFSLGRVKRHIRKHVTGKVHTVVKCLAEVSGERGYLEYDSNLVNGGAAVFQGLHNGNSRGECVSKSEIKAGVSEDGCYSVRHFNNVIRDGYALFQRKAVPGSPCASETQMKDLDTTEKSFAHSLSVYPSMSGISLSDQALSGFVVALNGQADGRHVMLCVDEPADDSAARLQSPNKEVKEEKTMSTKRKDCSDATSQCQWVTCAKCWRTFKRLSDLHVHMQCHTGEVR